MTTRLLLFLLTLVISLSACNNAGESTAKDMADFAEDETFKEAHETPREASVNGLGMMISYDTPDGQQAKAYALKTATPSDNYLLVIHEWWGLNDNIKEEAERLFGALENVNILALDIYDGKVADNPDDAGKYMQSVSEDRAKAIVQGALNMAGPSAKIATIGWCFGGGWSLKSSIMAGEKGIGCVMYYGMPVQKADELAPLKADILGIFAKQDGWITPEVAGKFEDLAKASGKMIEIHQFDANHAFANPSSEAYNEAAAQEANKLALEFLKKKFS